MSEEDPIKILKIRYAKGEINTAQYEEMLSILVKNVSLSVSITDPEYILEKPSEADDISIHYQPNAEISHDDSKAPDMESIDSNTADYNIDEPIDDNLVTNHNFPIKYHKEKLLTRIMENQHLQLMINRYPIASTCLIRFSIPV